MNQPPYLPLQPPPQFSPPLYYKPQTNKLMASKDDDFSFPATTTASPPRFLDSPPLWKGKDVDEGGRSVFELQELCRSRDEDGEEKMDLLWEDLNEDRFARNCAQSSDMKALKLSKRNGRMVSGKKTSVLVFIKILKKVFLMHNSQRAMNKKKASR